jgi:hypothetical protein
MKLVLVLLTALASPIFAATITFVPPNDTVGGVYSTNSNDGYSNDRGILFQLSGDVTIDSVGIFQDLTNVALTYSIYQTPSASTTDETGYNLLQTGTTTVTTSGLEWIDFGFSPLALTSGNDYYIAFSFTDNSNQNFYYDNSNVTWTQDVFTQLDGALAGNAANSVLPAIRLDESTAPEPSTIVLAAAGLAGILYRRKRGSGRDNCGNQATQQNEI